MGRAQKHPEDFPDFTECFYFCDPRRATKCRKTTCFLRGGTCYLTSDPKSSIRPVMSDVAKCICKEQKTLMRKLATSADLNKEI